MTAKGVPIDGKRSPIATHKRSPLSLKEESRWPPWDSVFKAAMAFHPAASAPRAPRAAPLGAWGDLARYKREGPASARAGAWRGGCGEEGRE